MARNNGVDIHFLEDRSFVFNFLPWDGLHTGEQLFNALATVGFHDSDHHVFAAASAAERLAQHAEGLADSRSVAEEKLEYAACFLRGRGDFQPIFRLLRQWIIFSPANHRPALEWANAEISCRPDIWIRALHCHR